MRQSLDILPSGHEAHRRLQEQAASAGGNAAMVMVVETCGGIGKITEDRAAAEAVRHNLAAFTAELGRPINEIEQPDFVPGVPEFRGIDEQDSTDIRRKLETAYLLYTTAMKDGLDPEGLSAFAGASYADLGPDELVDAGVDAALMHYKERWDQEAPTFSDGANPASASQ